MRREELIFLGIYKIYHNQHQLGMAPKEKGKDGDPVEKAEATRATRKLIQHQNQQEYEEALVQIKKKFICT